MNTAKNFRMSLLLRLVVTMSANRKCTRNLNGNYKVAVT